MNNENISYQDLFPDVGSYELTNPEGQKGFLENLGFYCQQAILAQNEFIAIDFAVKKNYQQIVLSLNWDKDLDLDNEEHRIDLELPLRYQGSLSISFKRVNGKTGNILAEKAKSGFSIDVLKNKDIHLICLAFLLSGESPDLNAFDEKTHQTSLF